MTHAEIVAVDIVALVEDQASANPIVLLRDPLKNRVLPIWIGDNEARAIALALNHVATPRPLTHRLLLNVLKALGATVSRIIIDRLKNNTYYASLGIIIDGKELLIDARPSDSLALAVEAQVPIFVLKAILDKAGHDNPFPSTMLGASRDRPNQALKNLKEQDLKKIHELLEKARAREQQSSGE